jgi:N-acetylgalactosamine-6-sulfatase
MTHLITDASIAFVERHQERPFFLYVAHECPHFPFQGPDDKDKVVTEENWTERDADTYVAMLEDLDAEVGRLLAAIDSAGLTKKTLVAFVSDNGGVDGAAHMGGLRGAKSTTWEGGIRVPLIIRWPGRIEPGTVSDQVSATFDLTHSFLRLAGADVPAERLDGRDIVRHIVEQRDDFPRTLFWRGKRGGRTWWAVRDGDLKYVRKTESDQTDEWLFNLAADLGEQQDLLETKASTADRLRQLARDWEEDVKPVR